MANVLFTRDSLTNIENPSLRPVTDGQLLFDTSGSGKMYMDVGTQRLEMGGAMTIDSKLNSTSTNPIQNKAVGGVMLSTLDEINATTSKGFITDALATRALAQKIGTTDISGIGDGTCTGAISSLNASLKGSDCTAFGAGCDYRLRSDGLVELQINMGLSSGGTNVTAGTPFENVVTLPQEISSQRLIYLPGRCLGTSNRYWDCCMMISGSITLNTSVSDTCYAIYTYGFYYK